MGAKAQGAVESSASRNAAAAGPGRSGKDRARCPRLACGKAAVSLTLEKRIGMSCFATPATDCPAGHSQYPALRFVAAGSAKTNSAKTDLAKVDLAKVDLARTAR